MVDTSGNPGTSPAEEARMDEAPEGVDPEATAPVEPHAPARVDEVADGLDQPEDEATEHALRLMDEALRRNDAGRRWLVSGDS